MKLITTLFIAALLFSANSYAKSDWDDTGHAKFNKPVEIKVYRDPNCNCCHNWIKYLQQHNFKVIDQPVDNVGAVKQAVGVPVQMASCHTAVVDGYVLEGHVPAQDIIRLLKTKPAIKGLAVPEMPVGAPGMERGPLKRNFAVFQFDKKGHFKIYDAYRVGADHHYQELIPPKD